MNVESLDFSNIFQTYLKNTSDLILILDKDFKIVYFNDIYKKFIFSYYGIVIKTEDNFTLSQSLKGPEFSELLDSWLKALGGETIFFNYTIKNIHQGNREFDITFYPILENNIVVGAMQIAKDITQYKDVCYETDLNKNFYVLANSLPQIVWTATPDGLLDYFNERWYTFSGLNYETSVGTGWAAQIHPDDLPELQKEWMDCLSSGKNYYVQARVRTVDGNYRWLLIRALPYRNENNEIGHWFGTCTDIEDQKESELHLQNLSRELTIANEEIHLRNIRLTKINLDLDNFVYTASHDLKGPIYNIESLVTSLYESLQSVDQDKEESLLLLNLIEKSVERFKNTVNDLSEIAKVQSEEIEDEEEIDFKDLLKEVSLTLNGLIAKYGATVESDFTKAPKISFSTKNLRSIYYNLISNAIKYSSPERKPHVVIYTNYEDGYLVLNVKDNGLGIKELDKEKVFKIFKRLHLHVEGSGVGMAIVKKIIDNQGGKIDIESEVGKGTTFKIYFVVK